MSERKEARWNPHAAVLGLIVGIYVVVYARVIIRLIYHYNVVLSYVSVVLISFPVLLLLLILYLISKKPWSKLHSTHYWSTGIIGVILLSFSIYALSYNQSQQHFDYNRWVGYPEQRLIMVDDFLQKHDLIGLTQGEVMDLLGANDNAKWANATDDIAVYDLGARRRADYKREGLFIYFDDRGYVKNYEILPR
ncbi:hypothetical protein MKY48_22940 [Paenibacillus sp. FSL W8-0187]|uniref:hypothetical protein n=1 Tax=Paenibacillus sp. FSL W8-0187 TaxID=2921710 RepID=UPI0030DBA7D3